MAKTPFSTTYPGQNRNILGNGNFFYWQRGISLSVSGAAQYLADRWQGVRIGNVAGLTMSRQTANLAGSQYCMRVQRDNGNSNTADLLLAQTVESIYSIPYQGKKLTLSFWARSGANFSASGGTLTLNVKSGTGTDQNGLGTFTGQVVDSQSVTLTSSWQKFTITTASLGAAITQLACLFRYTPVGTAGANDYFEVTKIMLNEGEGAAEFAPVGGSQGSDLLFCQRYYNRLFNSQISAGPFSGAGIRGTWWFPTVMRVAPSLTTSGTLNTDIYYEVHGVGQSGTLSGVSFPSSVSLFQTLVQMDFSVAPSTNAGRMIIQNANGALIADSEL